MSGGAPRGGPPPAGGGRGGGGSVGSCRAVLVEVDLAERAVAEAGVEVLAELGGLEGGGAVVRLRECLGEQARGEPPAAVVRQCRDHRDEGVILDVLHEDDRREL